jgi:myo-inositol catabolism protein IolC
MLVYRWFGTRHDADYFATDEHELEAWDWVYRYSGGSRPVDFDHIRNAWGRMVFHIEHNNIVECLSCIHSSPNEKP